MCLLDSVFNLVLIFAQVRLLPPPHEFTARQVEYLERQYEKLDPFPTSKVFRFLAKQLKELYLQPQSHFRLSICVFEGPIELC